VLAPNYRASALGPIHVTVSFKSFEAMRWTRKPSGSDLERAVLGARLKDADGVAVLTCRSDPSGELTACQVTSSQPDSRYGEAAMRLTSHFGLKPAIYDGQPVSAPVRVPITFNMP
jgi:TonB family protein